MRRPLSVASFLALYLVWRVLGDSPRWPGWSGYRSPSEQMMVQIWTEHRLTT